ncbi:MAG: hypothetical protein P1V51_24125 [Deltaproteobacteria bacterium]|nr:hypothetical protein [Deltaproteobacteria bacterium]
MRRWGRTLSGLFALTLLTVTACPEPPAENQIPVADAGGDQTVPWGQTVVLQGSCTDPDPLDAESLTYAWRLESSPVGSAITPATPDAIRGRDGPDAFFDADVEGDYILSLECTDPQGAKSALSTVVATVLPRPPNQDPSVDAGPDATLEVGATVNLSASGSDPDGDGLTFAWSVASAPTGATVGTADIVNADSDTASIVPDLEGAWTFEVSVADGRGGTATDQVVVTLTTVENLNGSLTITALDAASLTGLEGAEVWIDDRKLAGTTNASGQFTETDAALVGPVTVTVALPATVSWDHDGDPATPGLTRPSHRMVSVTGVDRPEISVVLPLTEAGTWAAGRGRVVGAVPAGRFDALPAIRPFFSLAGGRISGQLKLVLVMPLIPRAELTTLHPGQFFAPSPTPAVPLPGNMTTDDSFLNDNATLFDRLPGPNGEPPFTLLEMDLPAGPQRLFVVEGIATVDMQRLLPLLVSGAGEGSLGPELGIVMGAIDLTTLSVGMIAVDVPAGGEVDISALLADEGSWVAQQDVSVTSAQEIEDLCDESGACLALERLRIFPDTSIELAVGSLPADARVASALPSTSPFEIFCMPAGGGNPTHCDPLQMVDVAVPGDTSTDVPFAVNIALLEIPVGHALAPSGGLALTGYRFARAPGLDQPISEFAVPPLTGAFAGLSYAVSTTATRRASSRDYDGAFFFQPGASVAAALRLSPGAQIDFDSTGTLDAFPSLAGAAPLPVEVLFDVEDNTIDPPVVTSAQAMITGGGNASAGFDLPATLSGTFAAGDDFRSLLLSSVDRSLAGVDGTPVTTGLWEVHYAPTVSDFTLPTLPAADRPLGSGAEVWIEASGWKVAGAYSYRAPDPELQTRRRVAAVRDTFAYRMP